MRSLDAFAWDMPVLFVWNMLNNYKLRNSIMKGTKKNIYNYVGINNSLMGMKYSMQIFLKYKK